MGNAITWEVQAPEVAPGGDVGGDYQAGEAWSVRLASPQAPGSLITVYVFAEARLPDQGEAPPGSYHVQVITEYLTCTDPADPGGTETWSEYVYSSFAGTPAYPDASRADDAALKLARRYAALPQRFTWDGQPFHSREDRPQVRVS